ncbi:dentin sialophosphoprotein-like isoform X3 [Parambassis ranga]|uniref:Dentin sialophosphoprotein-like isoform X3 n=1 Tax=Parambassis ranga TaxID=210632 RepID=A0A6P7HJH1_9TELE|nr:dentin sialophosphoprotein-like isoform X3 [Parambassis ranga]
MQLQCFLQLTKKKHMLSLIRATGRTLSVWLHGGSEQTVENHARWSPPSSESSDCSDVVMKLSPPHSESSNNSSDVSLRRSWSKDVLFDFKVIHLSRKRKHELISGSSDSSDQSSKSSCTDLFPDMRLCEEMEGKQHLYKILLSGPHGIRDRLMSSNQDQPQSEAAPTSPGSSKTCDVLMKSDGSKGRADTDRSSPPRPESSRPQTPDEALQISELLESDEVLMDDCIALSPPLHLPSVRAVYSRRRIRSMDNRNDFKGNHLSINREPVLSSGSSDSLDQSSKSSCTDLFPDRSLCEETEGIDHLFLSGPHGIRDGLMSSNQDQPQSEAAPTSPGSSKTCDVLMKSDGSKGRADTDRSSPPRPESSRPQTPDEALQSWKLLLSDEVLMEDCIAPSPPLQIPSVRAPSEHSTITDSVFTSMDDDRPLIFPAVGAHCLVHEPMTSDEQDHEFKGPDTDRASSSESSDCSDESMRSDSSKGQVVDFKGSDPERSESSDCSDGSMKSDSSKGQVVDFKGSDPERSSPPRPESSRPQTPDEALQSMRRLKSHKVCQGSFPLPMPCLVEGPAPLHLPSLREILEVREREEHKQKLEGHAQKSQKLPKPDEVCQGPFPLPMPYLVEGPAPPHLSSFLRPGYSKSLSESSDCSDVSLSSEMSRNHLINFKENHLSSKRRPELSFGSSDSLHLSDDSLDEDWSSKSRYSDRNILRKELEKLRQDREGKNHLLDLFLIGPHGTRDGLMSSNQDQPQSEAAPTSPGSSKTCDVLMKSDGSKGRADTDRKRRSGRCRGEKGQVKPGVRTHHRGHSQM